MSDQNESETKSGPAGISRDLKLGILPKITTSRNTLSPTGQRIADYMYSNADDIIHMSATEVADATGTSDASVVNLCRQLGMKGFQDLKIRLARELVAPIQFIHEDLQPDDDVKTVIHKIFQSEIQALVDTLKVLDEDAMKQAVDIIL